MPCRRCCIVELEGPPGPPGETGATGGMGVTGPPGEVGPLPPSIYVFGSQEALVQANGAIPFLTAKVSGGGFLFVPPSTIRVTTAGTYYLHFSLFAQQQGNTGDSGPIAAVVCVNGNNQFGNGLGYVTNAPSSPGGGTPLGQLTGQGVLTLLPSSTVQLRNATGQPILLPFSTTNGSSLVNASLYIIRIQ